VKIGTSTDLRQRLGQLQFLTRSRVRLLATTPGSFSREREIHRQFASARVHGEWFRPTPELLAFIGTLKPKSRAAA